jgi:hypothetical protein
MPLKGYVHYTGQNRNIPNFPNAEYSNQAVYFGDGDEEDFGYFANGLDLIAHEVTHGITESFMLANATTGPPHVIYLFQTGSLNESMSDVFACIIEQYHRNQTVEHADWLLGEGILTVKSRKAALRSLKAPGEAYNHPLFGKDPQPRHMNNYVTMAAESDHGGAHTNSGIPNYAFYLVATRIGGYSWEGAGKIWWAAYTKIPAGCNFERFARLTIDAAPVGRQCDIVRGAWEEVGVLKPETPQWPPQTPQNPQWPPQNPQPNAPCTVTCDRCSRNIQYNIHFHCNSCNSGNYDLCRHCYIQSPSCPGRHPLDHRKYSHGVPGFQTGFFCYACESNLPINQLCYCHQCPGSNYCCQTCIQTGRGCTHLRV